MTDTNTTDNAARPQVPAPEQQSVAPEVTAVAVPEVAAETAILPAPTAPQLPTPPVSAAPAAPAVPVGHQNKAAAIEANLARFVGDRLPPEFSKGLMVDVKLANSNAVTGEGSPKDAHDIAITFKGGELENTAKAQELATLLRAALREHPAFTDMGFGGADQQIEHFMRCQILAIEPERLEQLLTAQPAKHVTFVTPPKDVALEQAPAASAAVKDEAAAKAPEAAATDVQAAAPAIAPEAEKLAEQPMAETKPAALDVAPEVPATTIATPAANLGKAEENTKGIAA